MNEQERKNLAMVAIIITHELYRPLLLKTLLSQAQTDTMLSKVIIKCHDHLSEVVQPEINITLEPYRNKIIQWARQYIFDNNGLKL